MGEEGGGEFTSNDRTVKSYLREGELKEREAAAFGYSGVEESARC